MNALESDIKTVVQLLEYQSDIYSSFEVPVTKEVLDKFKITEPDFTVAMRNLVKKESNIKIIYEHIDGDIPTGPENEIEFYKILLPDKFKQKIVNKYTKTIAPQKESPEMPELFSGKLRSDLSVESLKSFTDGTIRYKGEIIKMRAQMKDLCRLFMKHPDRLITFDDIREAIVHADRRSTLDLNTISKYVAELRGILKRIIGKNIIYSQRKEGWILKFKS